jgi:uncharacterized protein
MRVIKNLISIDLKNENSDYLFVNGINGSADIIHKKEREIVENWQKSDKIIVKNEFEKSLYDYMSSRQYIMNEEDEQKSKQNVINRLKKTFEERVQNQRIAWFVLTYSCNFACPYCYEKDVEGSPIISKDMVDKIFSSNPNIEYIGFFGGEPLLNNNMEIIKYIISKAPNAKYSAITNGYNLVDYMEILKSIDVLNIQVTLDGAKDLHNKTRCLRNGLPSYDRIIDGVKKCIENEIPIKIRMNISPENIENCLEEKRRIESTEWGKNVEFELQPLFQCSSSVKTELHQSLFDNDTNEKSIKNQIYKKLSPISDFLYNGKKLRPILKNCDRDGQSRFYDPYGNIYNCILAVGKAHKSIGQYYPEFLLKEKSYHTRDITTIETCKNCANSLLCGGGCPNALPEEIDVFSPNCYSFLNDISDMVPLVDKIRRNQQNV